jgi:hypothetical protein
MPVPESLGPSECRVKVIQAAFEELFQQLKRQRENLTNKDRKRR